MKTKTGYLKDGFVVDNKELECDEETDDEDEAEDDEYNDEDNSSCSELMIEDYLSSDED